MVEILIFSQQSFDTFWSGKVLGSSLAQVPTKVCTMEEVPLCSKQEVVETKKVRFVSFTFLRFHRTHYLGKVCKAVPSEVCEDIGEKCIPQSCDYSVS